MRWRSALISRDVLKPSEFGLRFPAILVSSRLGA